MARRRLSPPTAGPAPDRDGIPADLETKSLFRLSPYAPGERPAPKTGPRAAPPIAQVAGEAAQAGAEALRAAQARAVRDRAAAATLEAAEAEGRVLLDIPLEDVAEAHLERDRAAPPDPADLRGDEEMAALMASLRARGQRTPAEVVLLEEGGEGAPPRYGLISGWRRLAALRALHAETGEPRFARLRAILRAPASAAEAYAAMVEENEIRQGLSYYERGRIAVLAAGRGAFPDPDAAVDALFASASKAKRSKIRGFMRIHEELGAELMHPAHLPERVGLRIAGALKAGRGDALRAALIAADPARDPEAERELLLRALSGRASRAAPAPAAAAVSHAKPAAPRLKRKGREVVAKRVEAAPGLYLEASGNVPLKGGGHAILRFTGPGLDAATLQAALEAAAEAVARVKAAGDGRGEGEG